MKKLFKKIILASSLLTASTSLWADAVTDLESKLNHIESLKANFSQTVLDELGGLVDQSSGIFELQRPQKFRWLVRDPYEQDIIADGTDLWQFDRDIEQINVDSLSQTFANSPAALLSNTQSQLTKDYQVSSVAASKEGVSIFKLVPNDEEALFEQMVMEFHGEQLFALQVKDNLGQTTLVELNQAEFNLEFSEQHFNFVPPNGIDVIDARNTDSALSLDDFESSN